MIKKALKYAGIGSACLTIMLGSSALLYKKYLQHRVAVAHAMQSPPGSNPILLFIHGSPGIAFMPLAGAFQGPWEEHFTVVQWEQRGAGKTYAASA